MEIRRDVGKKSYNILTSSRAKICQYSRRQSDKILCTKRSIAFYYIPCTVLWELCDSETMKLGSLRPGMEHVDLKVRVIELNEPREVTTYTGVEHVLVDGEVEDKTGRADLAVWNDSIKQLDGVGVGSEVKLKDCLITSFKGVLQVNVGRDSEIIMEEE